MTTIPEEWDATTSTLQEDQPGGARCSRTIDLQAPQKPALAGSRTTRVVGADDRAAALVVITRKDRITVPLDINWEIQRAKNLLANKVRLTFDTTHEESTPAEATCPYKIS